VIIQDEKSSVVWGMPGLVHASGLDDASFPLDQLAAEITRRVLHGRNSSRPEGKINSPMELPAQ
jgi:chemotaxis response regulator CheB